MKRSVYEEKLYVAGGCMILDYMKLNAVREAGHLEISSETYEFLLDLLCHLFIIAKI